MAKDNKHQCQNCGNEIESDYCSDCGQVYESRIKPHHDELLLSHLNWCFF